MFLTSVSSDNNFFTATSWWFRDIQIALYTLPYEPPPHLSRNSRSSNLISYKQDIAARLNLHATQIIHTKTRWGITEYKTRMCAIAKALHLEGHSDFTPDILGFSGFFWFENIVFGRFAKCAWRPPRGFRVNTDSRQICLVFYLFTAWPRDAWRRGCSAHNMHCLWWAEHPRRHTITQSRSK